MSSPIKAKICFISAGAGSGKTHRLTEILHSELTQKGMRPSGVIATTFTKKAAAELRERVRSHLLGQGDFALAHAMGQARIGTVNSVSGSLIERFAFEAGMATDQQVLDEAPASALLERAIDAVLAGPAMGAFLAVVRRLGLMDSWKTELKTLVDLVRANDIPVGQLAAFATSNAQDLLAHFPQAAKQEDLSAVLHKAIAAALPDIEIAAQKGGKKNTNEYLANLRDFSRALNGNNATWGDWIRLSKMMPEAGLRPIAEPIAAIAARAPEHAALHEDVRRYLFQIFDLCAQALGLYARNKREMGVLDFADQESILLKLLDHPTVAQVLSEELDLLLVDEFQDTSPIQLALFLRLSQFAKAVYWVGDVKQAIYGFRGSDTALMQEILKALPTLGGAQEVLPSSWRSRPELVSVVNEAFRHAFANTLARDEIELTPTRTDKLPGAPVANWLLGGRNVGEEANALAVGIRRLVQSRYQVIDKGAANTRDVRYGDIAVLSRSHEGVKAVSAALAAQAVPCATSQPGLLATPETTLALACLRRVIDPSDTIATAEILALADCMDPEQWVADRLRHLQSGGDPDSWKEIRTSDEPAHPLIAKLGELRKTLPVLAPREALQTVVIDCDIPGRVVRWAASPDLAQTRLANLEALLNLAAQYEDLCRSGQHAASISGLILWLGEIGQREQDALAEPGIDAVKVMTHHAAKGLEWPVVVLMNLAADIKDRLWSITAQSSGALNVQAPLSGRTVRYWPWPFGAQQNVAVADTIALTPVAQRFRQAAIEESKRLLYVSMTRARDLLIFARSSRKPTGAWIDCLDSPWLLSDSADDVLTLPSGRKVLVTLWPLDPPVDPGSSTGKIPTPLRWFDPGVPTPARLPLGFTPSSTKATSASVIEKIQIGQRIPIASGVDMSQLGNAIHASIATSFTAPGVPLQIAEIDRILKAFQVIDYVSSPPVLHQVDALHGWIGRRWGQITAYAEIPVQSVLENGQVLNGRIDLLLKTSRGWVVIDHKSNPSGVDHWDELAKEFAAQLDAYSEALIRASGLPVVEAWIYLPVAGGGVRVH